MASLLTIMSSLVLFELIQEVSSLCPHNDLKLRKFSEIFPSHSPNEDILITEGTLLDVDYLEANSIEITGKGKLVFNQGHPIEVWTKSILINQDGQLIIGSEICRHIDEVDIMLIGSRSADGFNPTEDGRKFIAVHDQGMLHIFGQLKKAWTKLTKTVPRMQPIYQHQTSDKVAHRRWMEGLVVYIFDKDRNRKVFDGFDLWKDDPVKEEKAINWMTKSLGKAGEGDIVSVIVNNYLLTHPDTDMEPLYVLIEDMAGLGRGELQLRNVAIYDAYCIVFEMGKNNVQQSLDPAGGKEYTIAMASITTNGYKLTAYNKLQVGHKYWSRVDFWIVPEDRAYPEIEVLEDITSWKEGDEVLLTSTDYAWNHGEVRKIRQITGPKSFTLQDELMYRHFGEIENNIDMRGEVALLTRNIRISGVMSLDCPPANGNCNRMKYDTFGGHIKINSFRSVMIDGASVSNMGQNTDKGFYPIHFHMCKNITYKPAIVRRSVIRNTFQRAITIHGTFGTSHAHPGVQVSENVAYNVLGHCYFLEDGPEIATIFYKNLGAEIKRIWNGFFQTDNRPSIFWITNPQTVIIGNVAAGSEGFGIWYSFPDAPLGESRGLVYRNREAAHTPLYNFDNNVVHSNIKGGMNFDNIVLDDNGRVGGCIRYAPVEDPKNINSNRVKVQLSRLTAYKNVDINLWLRGGGFEVIQFSSAESKRGIQLARGGRQQQFVSKSVFVGISERNGEIEGYPDAVPPSSLGHALGIVFYDGPIYIDSTYFTAFKSFSNGTFAAGAMGFNPKNKFSSSVVSNVTNIRFGFVDGKDGNRVFDGNFNDELLGFGHFDGDEVATFRDGDGTVALCPDVNYTGPLQVVKPEKYILTENCTYRENWQMAICKDYYGKIKVSVMETFVLDHDKSGEMRRVRYDNHSDAAYEDSDGVHSHEYMVILGSQEYFYQFQFKHEFPKQLRMTGNGVEKYSIPYEIHIDAAYEDSDGIHSHEYIVILGSEDHFYQFNFKHGFPKQLRMTGNGVEKGKSVLIGLCLPEETKREDITIHGQTPNDIMWGDNAFYEVETFEEVKNDKTMTRLYFEDRFMYIRISSKMVRNKDWDKFDDDHCPGRYCPHIEIRLKQQAVSYSPCYSPTVEELTTDIYLQNIKRENCEMPAQSLPSDWGAGDTMVAQDGQWGSWSSWVDCCYRGDRISQTYRKRSCDNPKPYYDGKYCEGIYEDIMDCPNPCPTNGFFSQWSRWSDCFCDGIGEGSYGVKTRTRDCEGTANGGKFCWGVLKQSSPCSGDC